jgi:hypothetical protein
MLIRLHGDGFDSRLGTVGQAQAFTLEHLLVIHSTTCDLRWALAELAVRSIAALLALGYKRLVSSRRRLARRLHLASRLTPADTMVAAGGR